MVATSAVDERLLFEVAPPLMAEGRLTAFAHLHQLILSPQPERWSPALKDALRLAAIIYQCSRRVVADTGAVPTLPVVRRWRPQLRPSWSSVPASTLIWRDVDAKNIQPLPRTQRYLDDLPEIIIDRTLGSATPVVMPCNRDGYHWVVAGHISAFLARQRRPDVNVRVRLLERGVPRKRSLPEICADTAHLLEPLFRRHRRFLAGISIDDWEASFLAGFSRAQYFRIRGGK